MADDIERRLSDLERAIDNGRFVRTQVYEADQRAQERTDLAQERRFSDIDGDVKGLGTRVDSDIKALGASVDKKLDGLEARMEAGFTESREDRQWLRRQLITMLLSIMVTATIAALAMRAAG